MGMNAHPQRMVLPQHRAQFRRDALWQKNRDARSDAEKFNMLDGAQLAEHMLEPLVAEQQRIAAAQQHVAHFRVFTDVIDRCVKFRMQLLLARSEEHTSEL